MINRNPVTSLEEKELIETVINQKRKMLNQLMILFQNMTEPMPSLFNRQVYKLRYLSQHAAKDTGNFILSKFKPTKKIK